jgi:hypothetical protein
MSAKDLNKEVLKQIARDEYGCNNGVTGITPEILNLIQAQQEHIRKQEIKLK